MKVTQVVAQAVPGVHPGLQEAMHPPQLSNGPGRSRGEGEALLFLPPKVGGLLGNSEQMVWERGPEISAL